MEFELPEGATPLDADEADDLLLSHITTRGELDRWEQENIISAYVWIETAKPPEIASEPFVRLLHKQMFGDVWKWAGKYRKTDKNIGVPWYNIAARVTGLCEDVKLWIAAGDPALDVGVMFHHQLVSIHPFPNGNGRHARFMTDLLLATVMHTAPFTWGNSDLAKMSDVRRRYIDALHAADTHDLAPLKEFVRS